VVVVTPALDLPTLQKQTPKAAAHGHGIDTAGSNYGYNVWHRVTAACDQESTDETNTTRYCY
jgi:hypothetical protein